MTKRRKKLFAAAVILAGGLLVLAAVFWWRSANAPAFRFLGEQQAVSHVESREGRIDIYSWPAEFESVAAQAGKELLRAGFEDISNPADPSSRAYARPGTHQIVIGVRRARFEKGTDINTEYGNTPGWVMVYVQQTYLTVWEYAGRQIDRAMAPPPSLPSPNNPTGK